MKVLVSALEPSSNLHLKELLHYSQDVELVGIFSKELGTPLYDVSDMAIMGFVDAFKKYRWFKSVAHEMVHLAKDVDRVLLMDSSGFNLPLAKKLKEVYPNKEIIYYILPQVWASRKYRIKQLEHYCDKLFGILPFEVELYSQKAQYVGHPLLDEIKLKKESLSDNGVVAFMPGSRPSEIKRLFPIYKSLRKKLDNKEALLIIPSTFSQAKIDELYGDISGFSIQKETHQALYDADFAFICSGTATLEAALIGTPFSLNYIAKPFDYFIAKHILKIEQIGLANIILKHHNNTTLHRELIQDDVTIENLLDEYTNANRQAFLTKALELREYLGHGSSKYLGEYISIPLSTLAVQ
ncbi:MAG: lipid-A-disaccharide synthase [Campylobacterota bacterium]|nr:lipid-A-disaccharide synthase [Campylobacterota bacterium]